MDFKAKKTWELSLNGKKAMWRVPAELLSEREGCTFVKLQSWSNGLRALVAEASGVKKCAGSLTQSPLLQELLKARNEAWTRRKQEEAARAEPPNPFEEPGAGGALVPADERPNKAKRVKRTRVEMQSDRLEQVMLNITFHGENLCVLSAGHTCDAVDLLLADMPGLLQAARRMDMDASAFAKRSRRQLKDRAGEPRKMGGGRLASRGSEGKWKYVKKGAPSALPLQK